LFYKVIAKGNLLSFKPMGVAGLPGFNISVAAYAGAAAMGPKEKPEANVTTAVNVNRQPEVVRRLLKHPKDRRQPVKPTVPPVRKQRLKKRLFP
jgi:hypothetical protein